MDKNTSEQEQETRLVCPNGHSETFNYRGSMTTLVAGGQVVDANGNVVAEHDPNVNEHEYECSVCKTRFIVRMQNGRRIG